MNKKDTLLSITILTTVLLAGCGQEQVTQTQQLPNKETIKKIVNVGNNQNNLSASKTEGMTKSANDVNRNLDKNLDNNNTRQVQEGNRRVINNIHDGENPSIGVEQNKIEPEPKVTKLARAEEELSPNKDNKIDDLDTSNNTNDMSNKFRDINDYIFKLNDTYSIYSQYIDNGEIKKEYEPYKKQFANEIYNVLREGKKIKVDDPIKKQQLVNSFQKLKELYNIFNF